MDTYICKTRPVEVRHTCKDTCKDGRHRNQITQMTIWTELWHNKSFAIIITIIIITLSCQCYIRSKISEKAKFLKVSQYEKLWTPPGSAIVTSVAPSFKALQANPLRCKAYKADKNKHQRTKKQVHKSQQTEPKIRKNCFLQNFSLLPIPSIKTISKSNQIGNYSRGNWNTRANWHYQKLHQVT